MSFIQAALSPSCGNTPSTGPLRSTGITPLPHYYEPLRLPIEPRRGYGFPRPVDGSPTCELSLERVSQVPDDSVGIRRPLSPRRARPLQTFVASRSMTGFTPSGRLATLTCLTRPNTGSRLRITADAFAFRGSDRRITPAAARSATWRTNNYHGQFLSTDKNRQASPDAPEGNEVNKGLDGRFPSLPLLASVKSVPLPCLSLVPWCLGVLVVKCLLLHSRLFA